MSTAQPVFSEIKRYTRYQYLVNEISVVYTGCLCCYFCSMAE